MSNSQLSTSFLSKHEANKRKWAKPCVYVGLVIILAILPVLISSAYMLHILILCFIYIIASVSLRTIIISGQFPFAHGAFMGIGAYMSGIASKWFGLSPWLTMPLASLVVMGLGMLIGYPFSRLRALYYAMGSLFFGVAIMYIINAFGAWTGGDTGLYGIPPLFTGSKLPYYYSSLGLSLVSIIALYRFEFSRIGTNLKAISQSYLVASSVGLNEGWYRILALGVGCFFAGIAGAFYAQYNLIVSSTTFNFMATLWLFMYVLIGGMGSFAGPIIGTFVLILIPEFFRDLKIYAPYISACILLIVVYLLPKGLASLPDLVRSWYIKRRKGSRIAHASGN